MTDKSPGEIIRDVLSELLDLAEMVGQSTHREDLWQDAYRIEAALEVAGYQITRINPEETP